MNTYTILTNGLCTHRLVAETLTTLEAFERVDRKPTGPRAKSGKELVVTYVSEDAEKQLGEQCPKVGQIFPSLAEAARFMGAKVNSLYHSYRGERRLNGCYGLWGVEMGFCNPIRKSTPPSTSEVE